MALLVVVFVVGVLLMWVGSRARTSDDPPAPEKEAPPPGDEKGKHSVPRHYVHRSTMMRELESHVPGVPLGREAHLDVLAETDLDVFVAAEDPSETSGSIFVVTDEMSHEGMEPAEFQDAMLANADRELAALPFVWTERLPGFLTCETTDGRAAARLLRVEMFERLPFSRERALVMVPDLDAVLVADRENEPAVLELLKVAEARFAGKHWFTLTAFSWTGEGWRPAHSARRADQAPLSQAVLDRLLPLVARGVLQDFRDATAAPLFPPARTARLATLINATWLEGTSVIVPHMSSHAMLTLVARDESTASLVGETAAAFVECVEREGHSGLQVLEGSQFPPREVIEFLDQHGDADEQPMELSQHDVMAEMKKASALVLFSEPVFVLFADGRTVTVSDDEVDADALLEAMSNPAFAAWGQRVLEHRGFLAVEPTLTAAAVVIARKALEGGEAEARVALAALEKAHATAPLRGDAMAGAVELALKTEDSELIRAWVRRGVKEQPLNQVWHLTLAALQFSAARKVDDDAKKPFDAASWTSSQLTQFDEAGPRAALMPVLRPPGHTARAQAQMRELARQNGGGAQNLLIQDPQRWPFARGLEIELVYDFGKKMQPLTSMDATGGLAAELKDVAVLNLLAASAGVMPTREGAWFPDWTDGFAASRLLVPWEELDWSADEERTADVLAFTPVYDSFLVAPVSDAAALEAVLREAEQMVERADVPWRTLLTGLPWRHDAGQEKWVEYTFPATHPLSARVAALEARVVALRSA